MRYVVTGGAGFIGSRLALELQKRHDVIVIDNFSSGDPRNLAHFHGDVITADLCTFEWEDVGEADAIFHQAALTDTRKTESAEFMNVNVNAFRRLLSFACAKKIPVIYASSAAVYGNGPSPMKESHALHPLNPYGVSKRAMEEVAITFSQRQPEVQICGLRYFNVFGPNERFKECYASMVWQLYQQMKSGKRPRVFFDGNQTRDHVYVKDVVRSNLLALKSGKSGVFNVGTGKETSFNEIIRNWNALLGIDLEPDYFENPYSFFQDRTCADMRQSRKELQFEAEFTVKAGMQDYLEEIENYLL